MSTVVAHPDPGMARPALLPFLKLAAGLFAGLVLTQALLAGQGWFVDRDLIAIHGGVGGAVLLVAAAQAVLALRVGAPAGVRRRSPSSPRRSSSWSSSSTASASPAVRAQPPPPGTSRPAS